MTHCRLHLRRDADERKKKEKEKRKLGHATKSEQQFTTQFSPMLPRINRTIHDSKKGASHFWILCLIVESSISASHNKPECSRPGTEETFNRFNGSASVQCCTRLTSYYHLGRWSVAWTGTSFESRFKNLVNISVTYPRTTFIIVIAKFLFISIRKNFLLYLYVNDDELLLFS